MVVSLRRAGYRIGYAAQSGLMWRQRRLRRWQRLDAEGHEAIVEGRLGAILDHALARVPRHKALAGHVSGATARARLACLPPLAKASLRAAPGELLASDAARRGAFVNRSGGSTGEPIVLTQDREFARWSTASRLLFDEWRGRRPGDPQIVLWGSERDLLQQKASARARVESWLSNETWLNAFRMDAERMRGYAAVLQRARPAQILAYAESMDAFATFVRREGIQVPSPEAIMVSAGTLTPAMRRNIEATFGAPVFNRYGSREVGGIASQCEERDGLHVCEPTNVVEVLRKDGTPAPPGEVGEIVVTSLTNHAMPLLRYQIGDLGAWSPRPCPCGRPWPTLERIAGRVSDAFLLPGGGVVVPETFIHLIGVTLGRPGLQKFQFVQEALDLVRVRLVLEPAGPPEDERRLREDVTVLVRKVMGPACRVEIELVPDIPPAPSGKHRYLVRRVDAP